MAFMNDRTPNKREPDEGKAFYDGVEHGYSLGWNDAIKKMKRFLFLFIAGIITGLIIIIIF